MLRVTYDDLVKLLGEPDRQEPAPHKKRPAARSPRPPPVEVPRGFLLWGCGCRAELSSGEYYFVTRVPGAPGTTSYECSELVGSPI